MQLHVWSGRAAEGNVWKKNYSEKKSNTENIKYKINLRIEKKKHIKREMRDTTHVVPCGADVQLGDMFKKKHPYLEKKKT